jgi:NAD+ diphosphatase
MTSRRLRLAGVTLSPETLLELSLSNGSLDRDAHVRRETELITRLLSDAATRVLHLRGDRARTQPEEDGLRLALRAPEPGDGDHLVAYLGRDGGGTAYVALLDEPQESADEHWQTLRRAGAALGDHDSGLFAEALALANWHRTHTHCPRCGAITVPREAGWVRQCEQDGSEHYPRTDMAVIMAVTDDDDRILLARGPQWHERSGSVLAGFVEPGESLEAAVAREVLEEVGVAVTDVRYRGSQPWPFPASLMVGFTARAAGAQLRLDPVEIAAARWYTREEVAQRAASGQLRLSSRLSIARHLIEEWYGGPLAQAEEPVEGLRPTDRG